VDETCFVIVAPWEILDIGPFAPKVLSSVIWLLMSPVPRLNLYSSLSPGLGCSFLVGLKVAGVPGDLGQ